MSRTIHLECKNIPKESFIIIFDESNRTLGRTFTIPQGNSKKTFPIPDDWVSIKYEVRAYGYQVINGEKQDNNLNIKITGNDYYLDVSLQNDSPEYQNLGSIKDMISLYNPNANARQRFFLSLISLQSYFEYLTYAMLVLSEYMSEKNYDLQDSSEHIDAVFLAKNILGNEFFAEEIIIHPENKIRIPRITKSSIKSIRSKFHTIRQLRNDVIHAWGYKDISLADLKKRLDEIVGRKNKLQVLPLSIENDGMNVYTKIPRNPDDVFHDAQYILTALYCYIEGILGARARVIEERHAIEQEGNSRKIQESGR